MDNVSLILRGKGEKNVKVDYLDIQNEQKEFPDF